MLGDERTLAAVAKKFNRVGSTINNWSSIYQWQSKIIRRQETMLQEFENKHTNALLQLRKDSLEIVTKLKTKFKEAVEQNQIETNSISDLEKLLKLELLLFGEATERTDNNITIVSVVPRPSK